MRTHTVMVVHEDPTERRMLTTWVETLGYCSRQADTAEHALEELDRDPAPIVICNADMASQEGVWMAERVRERFPHTAVIMASSATDVDVAIASLRNEAVDYLLKPFGRERLCEALALGRDWHAASAGMHTLHDALQERLRQRRTMVAAALSEAQTTREDALDGLLSILQLHERDGRGHATRVARFSVGIADELGMDELSMLELEQAALLHDIGKLDMPRSILGKPAPLDDAEWQVMKTHPRIGSDLLMRLSRFATAAPLVIAHHEAFDGSGYPYGLAGTAIPEGARILAVADAYDSMTMPHTQRPPLPPILALEEIDRCQGSQFDPRMVAALGGVLARAVGQRVA